MFSNIQNIKIAGIASAVTKKWDSLKEISDEAPEIVEKFIRKTGVEGRYSALPRQTTSDFCFAAANELLEKKQIDRSQVGVLVYVTQTADYRIPATACVLQHRLDLSENLIAFDVNLGCSGFVNGLNIVASLMAASEVRYGLLLAGDTSAREFTEKHRTKTNHSAAMLFGDAGTATLLEKTENAQIVCALNTDGSGYEAIMAPYGFWRNPDTPVDRGNSSNMDDIAVFNFATGKVPEQINEYMDRVGTTSEDYDCLVLHQANLMIMKRITKKTNFPTEKMLLSMNKFGNTSSASIPITLVNEYGESSEGREINALCCGFGVGLSWGTVGLKLNSSDILPLIHTDEYFKDGYNLNDQEENNND